MQNLAAGQVGTRTAGDWISAAAGSTDITPRGRMVPLSGFGHRIASAAGVDDAVTASALVMRDGNGRTAVLMTIDALFVGPRLHACLLHRLEHDGRVASNDVLVLASHTHCAPALDPTKPLLGEVDEAHLQWVIGQCERLVAELLGGAGSQLMVRTGASQWEGAVYRRKPWPLPYLVGRRQWAWGEPAMASNPRGPSDTEISLWDLSTVDGRPLATAWRCACHPTGYPNQMRVSPDYCGVVRERLRREMGVELPILFMQGFCGDLRPRVPQRRLLPAQVLKTLIYGPPLPSFNSQTWSLWSGSLADSVVVALSDAHLQEARPATGEVRSASVRVPLSEIIDGDNAPEKSVTFQRLKLGNVIDMVAVSAEPSTLLRKLVPFEGATPIGYLGDVFGYWPTERQRIEGGYEGSRFLSAFGLRGRLRPGLDEKFRAAVAALSILS